MQIAVLCSPKSQVSIELNQIMRSFEDDFQEFRLQTVLLQSQVNNQEKEVKKIKKMLGEEFCELAMNPILCLSPSLGGDSNNDEFWTRLCATSTVAVFPCIEEDHSSVLEQLIAALDNMKQANEKSKLKQIVYSCLPATDTSTKLDTLIPCHGVSLNIVHPLPPSPLDSISGVNPATLFLVDFLKPSITAR